MPKKQPKNAFYFFMQHFKDEERRRGRYYNSLAEVSTAASKPWQQMSAQERGPFEKQAKDAKVGPHREVEKYTSQGIPLSQIEREQKQLEEEHRTMMSTISRTVVEAFSDNTIISREFFFISGNYFINVDENYLPAEIAIVKFSFEYGIISKFHTYVDPEKVPLGYQFEAKDNSEKTHRLPIPPNAKGERNYQHLLAEMKKFMGEPLPILFTSRENMAMIKSFISSFIDFSNNDDKARYRVYPLHQLFFEIKELAVKNCPVPRVSFKSIHIAEQHLKRDDYAYLAGTSCAYHEELDCAKYCALAHVQNWAYIFVDHICADLNIDLITGKHFPPEIDISHVADITQSDLTVSQMNDTKMNETIKDENQTFRFIAASEAWSKGPNSPDKMSNTSRSMATSDAGASCWAKRPKTPETTTRNEDFPTLGSSRNRKPGGPAKRPNQGVIDNPWNTSSSSSGSNNPWHEKNEFDSDSEEAPSFAGSDMNASHSRGMGRGSVLFRHESGFGRGRTHK